ncbi:DUF2924 domain-containing protein [Henriciella sp.]|uniref:DUF2924 domain-containing protein n=1 Tax=Henriciella sp. TaxID=1968823 RepID=UPI0026080738|nr:DUF2924 domain-containing protein [Henriciella sp.]
MSKADFSELSREELIARWVEIIGSAPPPKLRAPMMAKILTCEQQWQASGKPRAVLMRKLSRLAGASETDKVANHGHRLVREWNGVEHIVDVTEDGYVWKGRTWRSLSAIAREITGTKWSGPRFFGVRT